MKLLKRRRRMIEKKEIYNILLCRTSICPFSIFTEFK